MMLDSFDAEYEIAAANNSTEQELIRFMNEWGTLLGLRDAAALARILPDDLILTTFDGLILNKAEYLDSVKNIPDTLRLTDYDQQAQIFDQTAILRAACKLEIEAQIINLCYTATFVKRAEKWDVVAMHSSVLSV